MPRRRHIEGLEAARLANEKREPVSLLPSQSEERQLDKPRSPSANEAGRTAPPRLGKLGRRGDVILAPKAELQAHKAAFREVFGETLSDEFVDEMLTRLETALAPGPWDVLEAGTLNAAIALIASVKPQTELEALLAVQIAAQPTFRLGVNDVRAGRPIGTMSAADVLPSSHHIDSRCGSTASSTRRPFGFSGNAAGQSDEQPKAIATRCLRGKVGEDRKMTVETDHAKTQAN